MNFKKIKIKLDNNVQINQGCVATLRAEQNVKDEAIGCMIQFVHVYIAHGICIQNMYTFYHSLDTFNLSPETPFIRLMYTLLIKPFSPHRL